MSNGGSPYRGIINAENPNSHIQSNYPISTPQRSINEILDQNNHLKQMIQKIRLQKQQGDKRVNQVNQPKVPRQQFNRRSEQNTQRIKELKAVVDSQQHAIQAYREKLQDFEDNLIKVMKLDKDIHSRLVNPQPNNTLQTNVRNVLVALNGRAPYDKLIKMIESIKV